MVSINISLKVLFSRVKLFFVEHVTLQLRNNQEMVDCCLYRMIRKCKKLKYLEFDGVLRTVDLLRDICALHIENWKDEHEDRNTTIFNK